MEHICQLVNIAVDSKEAEDRGRNRTTKSERSLITPEDVLVLSWFIQFLYYNLKKKKKGKKGYRCGSICRSSGRLRRILADDFFLSVRHVHEI